MFRLERKLKQIDLAVPDFIDSYNERWKELHPKPPGASTVPRGHGATPRCSRSIN